MPCHQIRLQEVDLNVADWDLLEKSLKELGYTVMRDEGRGYLYFFNAQRNGQISRDSCKVTEPGMVNEIKREYAWQVLKAAGQRFKWNVKKTAQNRYQVNRRF
jgi:hypothetical protein